MADIVVDNDSKSLDVSDRLDGYSRVIIKTGETDGNGNDIVYVAGDSTGRTLEINNPWGNQQIAEDILARIQGWAYQPMSASSVKLPPAYELGDSIAVGDVFSGIYNARTRFSSVFAGDVEAPIDKEIDHEYQFEDNRERRYERKLNDAVARLNFFSDAIEAKVDKVNESTTFGWRLTENGWSVFNQNGNLFSVNAGGASVTGEIKANSGTIGGFTIGSNGISTNNQTYGGGETNGIYIGVNGIQLGTRFRVDSQGNLYAASGHFDGDVYASNIKYGTGSDGTNYGYLSGGAISPWSIDTDQFAQGVRNSLGYANLFNSATIQGSGRYPTYFCADTVSANTGMLSPEYWVYDSQNNAAGSLKGHTHVITQNGDTYTLGAPDFSGRTYSFSRAPSVGNVTVSLNGGATYQNIGTYGRYAIPIRATDQNGNVLATGTVYITPNEAYENGVESVDVGWSGGSYDIWLDNYQYSGGEVVGFRVNASLTNGKHRYNWVDWA